VELELESDAIYTIHQHDRNRKAHGRTPEESHSLFHSQRTLKATARRHAPLFLRPGRHVRGLSMANGGLCLRRLSRAGHSLVRNWLLKPHTLSAIRTGGLCDRV